MVDPLWLVIAKGVFLGVLMATAITVAVGIAVCRWRCKLGWHDLRAVFRNAGVNSPRSGVECIRCFKRWE